MFRFKLFSKSDKVSNYINRVIVLLWTVCLIGLLALIVPALVKVYEKDWSGALTVLATGLFLAGASTLGGSILGFLFGVPRRLIQTSKEEFEKSEEKGIKEKETYEPNTNLEQISDWLTKIIVGIGLIEFKNILGLLKEIGQFCGPALGTSPSGQVIVICIIVHYILVGFFQGFLLAYLWLPTAFTKATNLSEKTQPNGEK